MIILSNRFHPLTRIIAGAGSINCYLMSWLLIMEILIKDTKTGCGRVTVFSLVTNMLSIPFALGEASSESVVTSQLLLSHSLYVGSLLAWFFPSWVDFQLSVTLLCGSGILILLYIPESPVWLILHGKRLEYEMMMMEAAEINGRDIDGLDVDFETAHEESATDHAKLSLWSPPLRVKTFCLIYAWAAMAVIYYGTT